MHGALQLIEPGAKPMITTIVLIALAGLELGLFVVTTIKA